VNIDGKQVERFGVVRWNGQRVGEILWLHGAQVGRSDRLFQLSIAACSTAVFSPKPDTRFRPLDLATGLQLGRLPTEGFCPRETGK
jgi:hypothetical protein